MDEELKTFLVGMETRLASQIRDVEVRLEKHIAERIHDSETRLELYTAEKIRDSETRLEEHIAEKIHDSETRLLSEFWKWARNNDLRVGRLDQSDASTVARVSSLEERVFTLERKIAGSPN